MKNKTAFNALLSAVEKAKTAGNKGESTNEYYYPERDAAGNGFAVIRFLPAKKEEDVPFVKLYNHGFKGASGKWFIELCLTSIGQDCPVCSANSVLWNSGVESDKTIVRDRKRKLSYYSNILVVQDAKNPENEGKVFQFRYGQKIFDKIVSAIQPEFDDDEPINPFDPVEGANFKLKIRKVEGYPSYDKSDFAATSPIDGDLDAIMEQCIDLNTLLDKSSFKSHEELAAKHALVTGGAAPKSAPKVTPEDDEEEAPAPKAKPKAAPKVTSEDEESSDDLAYFARLASED